MTDFTDEQLDAATVFIKQAGLRNVANVQKLHFAASRLQAQLKTVDLETAKAIIESALARLKGQNGPLQSEATEAAPVVETTPAPAPVEKKKATRKTRPTLGRKK